MSFWSFIFGMSVGGAMGFVLAGIMAAGSRADDQDELAREMMRRRNREFTGDQGLEP